jgi:hypothetical protein
LMPAGQRRVTARERAGSGTAIAVHALIPSPAAAERRIQISSEQTHIGVLAAHLHARFSRPLHPRKSEGAGNAGCALHPRSRVQCARELRTRAYRAAESIRHSLRNGFTTYSALSLVIGFLATIALEKVVSQELDASTEASGPRAFVVRLGRARQSRHQRPPQPAPRSRRWPTPLFPGRDDDQYALDLPFGKREIFLIQGVDHDFR